MKLYIDIKKMTFEEEANETEHEIVLRVRDEEFLCYDYMIELSDDDEFIKDTLEIEYRKDEEGNDTEEIKNKIFWVREKSTWWSFPLYEIIDGKIELFDYTQYQFFADTDRRMVLGRRVNRLYNPSSEAKILRKTLRYIMSNLNIEYPDFFEKYNKKVEELIAKNPK